jgi:tetratricopeptide (TPR) repeat protein
MRKTSTTSTPLAPPAGLGAKPSRWGVLGAGTALVIAVWVAYANSLSAPFEFDDFMAITQNPTIRHLGRLGEVLSSPDFATGAAGRPVVSLSLAINYAIGGDDVTGYHVANTLIHAAACLLLFGIVRRTLLRPLLRDRFGAAALPLALAVALLWGLHPLLTESVTFVIQRSESLMGLIYLLTLYCFIRGVDSSAPRRWQVLAVVSCLVGMATKEVMVSAPLMLLLYDRTFVAGSFRAAGRERWKMYVGMAAAWGLLAYLMAASHLRGGAASAAKGVTSWDYALTQCRAIVMYLRLVFWPSPLVVDYGMVVVRSLGEVWVQGVLLVGLVAGTFMAMRRRPAVGFLGFWFFAILAPSSSVVPLITQTMAEHRMYLPLAAVITLIVLGGYAWIGKRSLPVWLALAALAGGLTVLRNRDYLSQVTLWTGTVAELPDNPRAQSSLGCALAFAGRPDEALVHLAEAVRLKPDFPEAQYNLGNFLFRQFRPAEALAPCEAAVRLRPTYFEAHFVLGGVLLQLGRTDEALKAFETTLQMRPNYVEARQILAETLARLGRTQEALEQFEAALRLRPGDVALHLAEGNALAQLQRWTEALPHFAAAVQLQPDSAAAQSALGGTLGRLGRAAEALEHFQAAAQLDPDSVAAHYNLGNALFQLRRFPEAAESYGAAVRLRPGFAEAHNNLGNAWLQLGRLEEAQTQYEEALRLNPDFAPARHNLERLQARRTGASAR